MLPGFPTSAIFTFHAFVAPVIRARAGLPPEAAETVDARVPVRIASEMGRKEFVLVSLVEGEAGPIAFPIGKGSGAVTSFSQADGFLEIDALRRRARCRHATRVTLIGSAARAPDLVIMGSHDIALDAVVGALAEQGFAARSIAVGSQGGVAAAQPRPMRHRAGASDRSGDRRIQRASADARPFAGARLAAHAGRRVPPGRQALRRQERGRTR